MGYKRQFAGKEQKTENKIQTKTREQGKKSKRSHEIEYFDFVFCNLFVPWNLFSVL